MRILVALDSFKGTMTAAEACEIVAAAIRSRRPEATVVELPMADGGEGTIEALVASCDGCLVTPQAVAGPLPGTQVIASYGWLPSTHTAVVEMARASGLPLVQADQRDPLRATTHGTGQLIKAALTRGCRKVLLTLGGSATVDGGTGAARALGWQFLDADGNPVPEGGGSLGEIVRIVPPEDCLLPPVEALCDVTNPLCGPNGAAVVYGPQKGATPEMVARLDANLAHLAEIVQRQLGLDIAALPGAGAAGGFGAGAVAFLKGRLVQGVAAVAEACNLRDRLVGADWVVTGEGRFDRQSLQGKVVSGILAAAGQAGNVPVAVLAGSVAVEAPEWQQAGVKWVESTALPGMADSEGIRRGRELLGAAAERFARGLTRNGGR